MTSTTGGVFSFTWARHTLSSPLLISGSGGIAVTVTPTPLLVNALPTAFRPVRWSLLGVRTAR